MKLTEILTNLIGAKVPSCPSDADVLAYSEGRLSTSMRAKVERHFAACDDCRHVLAFVGRQQCAVAPPTAEQAVSAQTNLVLAYIQNDENTRNRSTKTGHKKTGFYVSYPRLASVGLVIAAIAIGGVFMLTNRESPTAAAMDALRLAVKDARYTEARVSGGFSHSRYTVTRGGESIDDLNFDRARNKVKAAADGGDVDAKIVLARVYLARGTHQDAKQALEILNSLAKDGVRTPETLNDTGVAQFQLRNYDEAIAYFNNALAKTPKYDEALFNRALAEESAGRDAEARRDWSQFIDQSPDETWKNEARAKLNGPVGGFDR